LFALQIMLTSVRYL